MDSAEDWIVLTSSAELAEAVSSHGSLLKLHMYVHQQDLIAAGDNAEESELALSVNPFFHNRITSDNTKLRMIGGDTVAGAAAVEKMSFVKTYWRMLLLLVMTLMLGSYMWTGQLRTQIELQSSCDCSRVACTGIPMQTRQTSIPL